MAATLEQVEAKIGASAAAAVTAVDNVTHSDVGKDVVVATFEFVQDEAQKAGFTPDAVKAKVAQDVREYVSTRFPAANYLFREEAVSLLVDLSNLAIAKLFQVGEQTAQTVITAVDAAGAQPGN